MSAEGPPPLDPDRIKAFSHKTRIRILEYLGSHAVASVPELAKELRIREGRIDYHVRVLLECDYIEHAVTRKRNGKDTRFFGLKSGVGYSTLHLGSLFHAKPVTRNTLHAFACKVNSALEAGVADDGANPTLALEALALTEPHRRTALEALRLTVANLRLLDEQSRQLNIATDAPLVSVELAIAMVPATPPGSQDRPSK
jgi:hypothetical protein